jgi:hypothetical protein
MYPMYAIYRKLTSVLRADKLGAWLKCLPWGDPGLNPQYWKKKKAK